MSERRVTVFAVARQADSGVEFLSADGKATHRLQGAQLFLTAHDASVMAARRGWHDHRSAEVSVTEWGQVAEALFTEDPSTN